ncbi:carbohydrate esterase family 4 protein [Laccaria amethystina LaAM-08-1]|uniref:Carbohydrate esterase family 4 protein n=1 Tax=Laccaria amethystina LaAM-08-1 TaxID=1095629 RepID=A0A0C9Y399_9AGAR|nr:carbohydrate esterase family 4 protein [Laccaria amethystina LaAM-08-1]
MLITTLFLTVCLATSSLAAALQKRAKAQVFTKCLVPNTVALTFDDGPYIYMNDVVDQLKAVKAKGTFFLNGKNWACIYDDASINRVKYAYDNGFQVASHTWAHKDLTTLTFDQKAIQRITGAVPAFMRPPYGNYNDVVLTVAGQRGQSVVTWDFDSQDGLSASVDKQKQLYDQVVSQHPSTILSLQHEVHDTTVHQTLPYAIKKLLGAGYKLVTLSECLGMPAYQSTGPPTVKDASWKC